MQFTYDTLRRLLAAGVPGLEPGGTYSAEVVKDAVLRAYREAGGEAARQDVRRCVKDYLCKTGECFTGLVANTGDSACRYSTAGDFLYDGPPVIQPPPADRPRFQVYGYTLPDFVELAERKNETRYKVKIGFTKNGWLSRVDSPWRPLGPQLVLQERCETETEARQLEQALHLSLRVRCRNHGETGEWFLTNEQDLKRYVRGIRENDMAEYIRSLKALMGL